jgi:chitinase
VLTGWSNSSVASAAYTLQVPRPTLSLPNGNYQGAQSVTISDTLAGVSIYYTTDNSTPTTASTVYTGPILVSTNTTIKAIATLAGWSNSTVPSVKYRIR